MKARILFVLVMLGVLLLASGSAGASPQTYEPSVVDPFPVRINEVMPVPAPGGHDWVELRRARAPFVHYLPVLPKGANAAAACGSLAEPLADPDISGWQISDQDGHDYTIPAALPPVPVAAFVVVHFDGLGAGADDYSFADGVAHLHAPAGLADIFADDADQVALYTGSTHNPTTIQDFVAYGGPPGGDAGDAVAAGLWSAEAYTGPTAQAPGNDVLTVGGSVGVYPGFGTHSPDDWAIYGPPQVTPGAANPAPAPYFRNPPDGIATTDHQIPFGWSNVANAVSYRLEVDDDLNFGSPLLAVDVPVSQYTPAAPLPDGTFYFRVKARKAGGGQSGWSAVNQVTLITVAAAASPDAQVLLGVTPQLQHKDSRMICLDGHNETGQHRWDSAHEDDGDWTIGNGNAVRGEPHDDMYCTRASISVIVDYFGGHLSQDRISYFHFSGGAPDGDMGHGDGLWPCESGSWGSGDCVFGWALNGTAPTSSRGKPTFNQAKGWIDAHRPILIVENGDSHSVVMDGYNTSGNLAHRVDPWTGSASWVSWSSWSVTEYHVPPAGASVRSDEANFATDADGDGITDWDEINRFHTDPTWADTDDDWVQDKQDIREYVFNTAGNYNLRNADQDGDGLRKERDPDNDGDGSVDGCEDTNYNGKYEAGLGETDNFNAASHQACVPEFEILEPTQATPVNAGAYNNPDKIIVHVRTATPASSPVTYSASDFSVRIGGQASTVVAVYQVLDTHMLVVSPHTQTTADYYDLQVTLGAQTDTETRAVFYLPKLRADQVIVIDRSGSMSDYGKMDAAKNAARAFIDHSNVDDMIGVASFASSAGPAMDYALKTVTGDPEWNAAKAAVTGLSAGGATALGQGARLGYDEIVAKGKSDHDWAMALLSDGMENVTPYWSDATVSGVIVPSRVVVHTVALGRDADRTLMAAIAGSTGGTPYEAGVDILPLAAAALTPGPSPEIGRGEMGDSPQYWGAGGAVVPGPNLSATLPNRLADVYKAIGEEIGHQQRLWEKTGMITGHLVFELPVEKGLPEGIFMVNWDSANSPLTMTLYDPDGNQIKPGQPGVTFQDDATHQQYRVREPKGGVWVVDLRTREKLAEYLFVLSAWSPTTMHLGFGLPPAERKIGAEIPILAILADRKPIKGAEVWAWVQGPNSDLVQSLQLFDDGGHADGQVGDGVYGNLFTSTYQAGAYVVKATGWGVNNSGQDFVRHRTGGFTILPRVAYIWSDDLITANAYRGLLEANGFTVDLVHLDDVPKTPWYRYSLILVGPETGDDGDWGTSAALNVLRQYPVPVIGLGEGGYAFFGKLGLDIGYPHGSHGQENRTYAMDLTHQVWQSPYDIPVPRDRIVTVYKKTAHVDIYVVRPTADMTLIGRVPGDKAHYDLIQQTERYLLWGFQAGPATMTGDGQHLFVNTARYMVGM